MPSNHLILCRPFLLLPSIFPSISASSNESALCIRWPKYWKFSFSTNPSNQYSGLISFRIDWFDLLAVQGTLKSSPASQFESINSVALSLLHGPEFKKLKRRSQCLASEFQTTVWLLLQANAGGGLKLKIILIFYSEITGAPKDCAKSPLPALYKCIHKAWMIVHLFIMLLTKYFKLSVEIYYRSKKDSFQNITAHW